MAHIAGAVVSYTSDIGFIASALVLAAFGMKDMVNLRVVAICSNIAFINWCCTLSCCRSMVGAWRRRCSTRLASCGTGAHKKAPAASFDLQAPLIRRAGGHSQVMVLCRPSS